jgi:hypothetical protein
MEEEKLHDKVNLNIFEQAVSSALRGIPSIQPNIGLSEAILGVIEKKKRFYALIKLVIFSLTSIISLIGLYFIWQTEGAIIINSEAGQLLSLLFSDTAIVLSMWREYLLSLTESLPIVSIVLVSVFIWAFCASLWAVSRLSKKFLLEAVCLWRDKAFKHA